MCVQKKTSYSPTDCYYKIKVTDIAHDTQKVITKATPAKAGSISNVCSLCNKTVSKTEIAYPKTITLSFAIENIFLSGNMVLKTQVIKQEKMTLFFHSQ